MSEWHYCRLAKDGQTGQLVMLKMQGDQWVFSYNVKEIIEGNDFIVRREVVS